MNTKGRPPIPDEERADSQIQLRVTRSRKALYVRAANSKQQSLAAWMFATCDIQASQDAPQSPQP